MNIVNSIIWLFISHPNFSYSNYNNQRWRLGAKVKYQLFKSSYPKSNYPLSTLKQKK